MLKKMIEYMKLLRYAPIHFPRRCIRSSCSKEKRSGCRIEPIVMQTWVSNKLGWLHYHSWFKFRRMNQDLDFYFFDDIQAEEYMRLNWGKEKIYQVYASVKHGPAKADIFRYCYIYDNGGYYFDIKSGCKIPLSKSHNCSEDSFLFFEGNVSILPSKIKKNIPYRQNIVAQWAFGFKRKHPFLKLLIRNIESFDFESVEYLSVKDSVLVSTGPGMFSCSIADYLNSGKSLFFNNIDINGNGQYILQGAASRYLERQSYVKSQQ